MHLPSLFVFTSHTGIRFSKYSIACSGTQVEKNVRKRWKMDENWAVMNGRAEKWAVGGRYKTK